MDTFRSLRKASHSVTYVACATYKEGHSLPCFLFPISFDRSHVPNTSFFLFFKIFFLFLVCFFKLLFFIFNGQLESWISQYRGRRMPECFKEAKKKINSSASVSTSHWHALLSIISSLGCDLMIQWLLQCLRFKPFTMPWLSTDIK